MIADKKQHVSGYILIFKDGGDANLVLHHGTHEECRLALAFAPELHYGGIRPLDRAEPYLNEIIITHD